MISILKNFPVVIHQLFFLFSQLLILYLYGISYSGSLAYIGAVSTFIAILICLRWDIEILVSQDQTLSENLHDASVTIVFMTDGVGARSLSESESLQHRNKAREQSLKILGVANWHALERALTGASKQRVSRTSATGARRC